MKLFGRSISSCLKRAPWLRGSSYFCNARALDFTAATGSAIILFVALLPFLFFLLTIGLDVSRFYLERQRAQKQIDDAALFAYRYLPDSAAAEAAARNYLALYTPEAAETSISATADTITLALSSKYAVVFSQALGLDISLPIELEARAKGTPVDAFIALDTSSYLAPSIYSNSPWDNSEVAQYFQSLNRGYIDNTGQEITYNSNVLAEHCFNESFSALKRAAIGLVTHLSSFRWNAFGLGFFPGEGALVGNAAGLATPEFDVIRPVLAANIKVQGTAETFLEEYQTNAISSFDCAAAAENEYANTRYQFPLLNPAASTIGPLTDAATKQIATAHSQALTAAEAIWLRPVNIHRDAETDSVLKTIRTQLLTAPYLAERGILAAQPLKYAIILAGDVPRVGGLRFPAPAVQETLATTLQQLQSELIAAKMVMKLNYIVLDHAHSPATTLATETAELADYFQTLTASGGSNAGLELRALYAASPDVLLGELLGALTQDRRTAVISR